MGRDCTNPATHIVGFKVWASHGAKAKNGPAIESHFIDFGVCPEHAPTSMADFMTDDGKRYVTEAVRASGHVAPKWSTAEVSLIDIDKAPTVPGVFNGPRRS